MRRGLGRGFAYVATILVLTGLLVGGARLLAPSGSPGGAVPLGGAPYAAAPAAPATAAAVQPPAPAASTGTGLPVVDPTWLRRTSTRAGIPETAVAAYARATLRTPKTCGLGWTTLAAIGWIESHHGTLGDRVLDLDGTSSVPIVGPALDGDGGFQGIRATPAGTALHGDPTWDHAVGPMQFITSTWEQWGADGDGDGVVDPQDIDDASWAAARYLCADGRDLTSGAGWSGGIFSYNRSQTYLDDIYATATTYAERVAR